MSSEHDSHGSEATPTPTPTPTTTTTTSDAPPPPIEPVRPPSPTPPSPPPETAPARPGMHWPTLAASVVLSLAGGGLGAWAFGHFAPKHEAPAPAAQAASNESAPFSADQGDALKQQVGAMDERFTKLEERIDVLPKSSSANDVNELKQQVADLRKSTGSVSTDEKKVESLQDQVASMDKVLASLRASNDSLRDRLDLITARRPTSPAPEPTTRRAAARPAQADPTVDSTDLARGADLYGQSKYGDALKVFQDLQQSHPDDARVWYYSALARGFSTRDWAGETVRLVEKGIEREKAGTPNHVQIDDAFEPLTKATGKEWLDAYRQRAR